jgi:type VI secretion system secreted protein Hcp
MLKNISWRRVVPLVGLSVFAASLATFFGVAQPSSAHSNHDWDQSTKYYLKLDGVTGDSTDDGHKGEIELNSYRIMEDEKDTSSTTGVTTQLAKLGDNNLRFLADSSKASPDLFSKAASGDKIANAVLTVRKGNKHSDYLTLKMTDVVLTSYQNSGNDNNNAIDEVLLNYGTIQITHNEGTPIKKGWDFMNKQKLDN